MGYSTWLNSSSLDHSIETSTLPLFDDSPARDFKKVEVQSCSNEVATNVWLKNEVSTLLEELSRLNAENKRITQMLTVMCEKYNDLKRQFTDYMGKNASSNDVENVAKKRKIESIENVTNYSNKINNNAIARNNNVESSSSDEEDSCEKPKEEPIKAKISRVVVRTEASDSSLILKDGYQWRKYGQKVTRDNPCPRAYFKCSFAPSCPVKKKVQRSIEDQSMLVATYEGEHNHAPLTQQESNSGSSRVLTIGSVPCNAPLGSSGPTVTLDLTEPKSSTANKSNKTILNSSSQLTKFNSAEFLKLLADHMASSLTKDPNFTAALVAAIFGRSVHQSSSD